MTYADSTSQVPVQKVPSLSAPCDSCGQPGHLYEVLSDGSGNYFCVQHRVDYALATAACDDLKVMVKEACRAWLANWGHMKYAQMHGADEIHGFAEDAMREALEEMGLPALANAAD